MLSRTRTPTRASPRYDSIIGNVDTEHGTISELEKAFRDAGVTPGQMLTKTIRFYVKFLTEIGVTVSPHITKPRRPTPANRKNGGDKARARQRKPDSTPPPREHQRVIDKPTFQVLYELLDPNMGKEEEGAIWTLIRYLKKKEVKS